MCGHRRRAALTFKQRAGLLLDRLLPLPNLDRMNPVFLTDLVDRLYPTHRFQPHFGLELGAVKLARLRVAYCFSLMTVCSLNHCHESGGHYNRSFYLPIAPTSLPAALFVPEATPFTFFALALIVVLP